jgi:glycosyltransferase involved in cell wall biosynthesis
MRILFLAHLFPLPLDSGGKIKSYHTLRLLAAGHEVHTIAYLRSQDEARMVPDLSRVCDGVEMPLIRGKGRQIADLFASVSRGRSFIISRDFRPAMLQTVREAIDRFKPDVVHIDHLQMAQFVDFDGRYKTVLDNHNVESTIIKRVAETSESRLMRWYAGVEWPKLRKYELDVCRRCDLVLVVSEEDKAVLCDLDASLTNVECVPIGVDVDHFQPVHRVTGANNMLSVGTMYWPPNVDSMLYFCRDIMPLVSEQIADCSLTIAGQRPVDSIRALAADRRIEVTGYVDDERELAANCGVFIVPLRSGSGVRVKILNALAMGLPVVSTSIGAEGLAVRSGEHLMIADSPAEFAKAVVEVLRDRELADHLGSNGRKLVCEKYSWERVGERLLSLYGKLC